MPNDDKERPRRQTPAEIATRRAVQQFVAPLQEQVGNWQAEAVKYETIARRLQGSGTTDQVLVAEISALLEVVSNGTATFETALASAPEPVRLHSRVDDMRKVLGMIEKRLSETVSGLEPPAKK
jgi:hypothetical protein